MSTFRARLWGDEFRHGWETAEGYAILPDESTGWWYYAEIGAKGALQPTALRPGVESPAGLERGVRGAPPASPRQQAVAQAIGVVPNVVPSTGTGHVPVLLVNFSNTTATQTPAGFNTLLFGSGTYSMADYYKEVSYNQYTVDAGTSGIGGWYTASNLHDYYGTDVGSAGNDAWPGDLVYEAVVAANTAGYNFAPYDQDGDCYVDNIMIVHQGGGQEFGGAATTNIWSHSWDLSSAQYFGRSHYSTYTTTSTCTANPATTVKVNKYTISRSSTARRPGSARWASSPTSSATRSACRTSTTPTARRKVSATGA